MNPYVSITIRTFTIWIMAAVINALLCGMFIYISRLENQPIFSLLIILGICSLFFSAPGFFIFWLMMLGMIYKNIYGRALFRSALVTVIILGGITGFKARSILKEFGCFTIPCLIILSAVTSIMMHFNLFKKITGNDHTSKNYKLKCLIKPTI